MNAAHGGEGWNPANTSLRDEMGGPWGRFGVSAESGTLARVLLHRPGTELDPYASIAAPLWDEPVNGSRAREQVEALGDAYKSLGVEVEYLTPPRHTYPNLCFMRDLFTMTPEGAILARPASASRRGEERLVAARLTALGVPLIMTPWGRAQFEGPDVLLVTNELALVGHTVRTNIRAVELISPVLADLGYDVQVVQTAIGHGHLDGCLAILGDRKAMFEPGALPFAAYDALQKHGVSTLPKPKDVSDHGINIVHVRDNQLLLASGSPQTEALLRSSGFHLTVVDLSEIHKGGGSAHCLTGVIERHS